MPIFTMTQMHARIAELMARLTALERERAEIVAEINTLRSARREEAAAIKVVPSGKAGDPIDPEFDNRKEDRSVSPAFPLGESYDGT